MGEGLANEERDFMEKPDENVEIRRLKDDWKVSRLGSRRSRGRVSGVGFRFKGAMFWHGVKGGFNGSTRCQRELVLGETLWVRGNIRGPFIPALVYRGKYTLWGNNGAGVRGGVKAGAKGCLIRNTCEYRSSRCSIRLIL